MLTWKSTCLFWYKLQSLVDALQEETLQTQNSALQERVEELQNWSRRANLRIVNMAEGSENVQNPVKFVSEMLMEMIIIIIIVIFPQ